MRGVSHALRGPINAAAGDIIASVTLGTGRKPGKHEMAARVIELESLRADSLSCVERTADTLVWFAEQFQARGTIPRNIWRQLDRPLPKEDDALGGTFELWHAVLRAERALRNVKPRAAKRLADQAHGISEKLRDLLSDQHPTRNDLVARLSRDEIYGTFNPFSAAAILRSEVFPYRSAVTPSYLAGHILVAELKLAQQRAVSHSAEGIGERAPRIAAVAQGVHSLMLYVEHLRARASHFRRISDQLRELRLVLTKLDAVTDLPADEKCKAEDAAVRIALTVFAPSSEQCSLLLLATRTFFESLDESCTKLLRQKTLTAAALLKAFTEAAAGLGIASVSIQNKQIDGYTFARSFGFGVYCAIKQIESSLNSIFNASNYGRLKKDLRRLAIAAARLTRKHLGSLDCTDATPSIVDSARFGFVEDLITAFSEVPIRQWLRQGQICRRKRLSLGNSSGNPVTLKFVTKERAIRQLADLSRRYGLPEKAWDDPCEIVRDLGRASIGRSISNWWHSHSESYFTPSIKDAKLARTEDDWLSLRHQSFLVTQSFAKSLHQCGTLDAFQDKLLEASGEYQLLADQVQKLLRRLTQWSYSRGRELLLVARIGSGPVDPNELISALWVADRLGEPWAEDLELEALSVVQALQQHNGGFAPAEPLYQNRGFLFYPSSAQTIAALARFVTRGGAHAGDPIVQERLKRWEKVLAGGTRFLVSELVGGNRGLCGWHSDRHREVDRIDCSITSESVTALCRAIDAFSSLLNIEAAAGFSISWPKDRLSATIPADCGAGPNQVLPQLVGIVRDLRHRTGRYSALWQVPRLPAITRRNLLFYGPPGTGKTHFQQLIAGELGWPLVILTIGDFLAEGEDRVGARTVQIFNQLRYLSNACIVFDEFDEMVIRRAHKAGRHSAFDLLTPAMLPLLAALRTHAEMHNCLVTFTTNYVERLDRAAKRVGRVDDDFPLIYHDLTSRLLLYIKALIAADKAVNQVPDWKSMELVLRKTGLCSFPEMQSFLDRTLATQNPCDLESPRQAVDGDFYVERLKDSNYDKQVMREAELVIGSVGKKEILVEIPGWIELLAELEKKQAAQASSSGR